MAVKKPKMWLWTAGIAAVLVILWIPPALNLRTSEHGRYCRSNLQNIVIGLINYESSYGQLPPVFISEKKVALHSWRAAITPYLADLPQMYKWNEPWNGPLNTRLLTGEVIHIEPPDSKHEYKALPWHGPLDYAAHFRCPIGRNKTTFHGDYYAVVGNECIWAPNSVRTLENIGDGPANTLLVVESMTIDAYWSEPKDLSFSEMSFMVNDLSAPSISSKHPSGPTVAFADGAVRRLQPGTPASLVRALLTADQGDGMSRDAMEQAGWLWNAPGSQ